MKKKENEEKINLNEKLEDGIDNFFGKIEDTLYGENPDFTKDVPATHVDGNGIRKVNKIQTRKNLNKKILNKGVGKGLLIGISIGLLVVLIYKVIEKLLLA